jgi:hypothetical protein
MVTLSTRILNWLKIHIGALSSALGCRRDLDAIYGEAFHRQASALGIEEVPNAPHSPWQNPYAERVIGSIRRECLVQVIVREFAHIGELHHQDVRMAAWAQMDK